MSGSPEGRVTRIAYKTGPGPSVVEVSRNFETQLKKTGFERLLACNTDECDGIPFTEALDVPPSPLCGSTASTIATFGPQGDRWRRDLCHVLISTNNDDSYAQLVIAEVGAIENKMIDAAAMGLGETGHNALYGIYVDTDKAVIKPDSAQTLADIGELLAASPRSTCSSSATPVIRYLRVHHGPVAEACGSGRCRARQVLKITPG